MNHHRGKMLVALVPRANSGVATVACPPFPPSDNGVDWVSTDSEPSQKAIPMRHACSVLLLILALLVLGCCNDQPPQEQQARLPLPIIEVYFSPKGGCTEAVVKEIDAAEKTILVQAYSFTSAPIAKALVNAYKRGIDVRVILDKSQRTEKYSEADFLHNMGIRTWIDAQHAIAHNKVMVIDGATVITGSFNFTKAAEERNAENLLVIRDRAIGEKYRGNWEIHVQHSDLYEGRGGDNVPAEKPARKRKAA